MLVGLQKSWRVVAFVAAALLGPSPSFAQSPSFTSFDSPAPSLLESAIEKAKVFEQPAADDKHAARRACPGCPPRSVGRALAQVTIVNTFYGLANLVRGQVTARVTPKTWWDNMEHGWVWDLDDFVVNQIGHPYQGNNYYNAGRANGLSFYESAAMAAFGSATWEYYGETNLPSLNDFINTTMGGIAIGEALHRAAWLIRDTHATGRGRLMRELSATVLDPVTGYNRFRTGDASRIVDKPAEFVPTTLGGFTSAGVLWRGTEHEPFKASGDPFADINLFYGDLEHGRTRTPYDAFAMTLRLGGGSPISEASLAGRLLGQPMRSGRFQFSVLQRYAFENNDAYTFGAQSIDGALSVDVPLNSRLSLAVAGTGGLTVLGAIDSLPLGTDEKPVEEGDGSAGQGVSEGPRYYDYGPGANFGLTTVLRRDQRALVFASYSGRHVYSLDGVRANHFLQRARLDLQVPLHRVVGLGVAAEYFSRHTYYQDADRTEKIYRYPQFRSHLTWHLN